LGTTGEVRDNPGEQEIIYRKQIARQLRTQYLEGIYRPKYYTVTLKCMLKMVRFDRPCMTSISPPL